MYLHVRKYTVGQNINVAGVLRRHDAHTPDVKWEIYDISFMSVGMMTSSNRNLFRVTWPFVRGIHQSPVNSLTKTNDMELWCFLLSAPEQTIETPEIWGAITLIMTSQQWMIKYVKRTCVFVRLMYRWFLVYLFILPFTFPWHVIAIFNMLFLLFVAGPHAKQLWLTRIKMRWNKICYGPLVRYVKLRVVHAPGMPGTFSPPPTPKGTAIYRYRCRRGNSTQEQLAVPTTAAPGCQRSSYLWQEEEWPRTESNHPGPGVPTTQVARNKGYMLYFLLFSS